MPEKIQRILFVINSDAGPRKGSFWQDQIRSYFENSPHQLKFFEISHKTQKSDLKKIISDYYPNKILAVGGDGTASLVAGMIAGKNIELGILPAGSANGMAKELKISMNPRQALDLLMVSKAAQADLIRINHEHYCLHLADVGINAQLVKHFQKGPIRGKFGYALALVKSLLNAERIAVSILSKDKELRRSAILVIIANASKFGTGAVINPKGDLHDGFFEVVIVRRIGIGDIFKMFFRFQDFDPAHIEIISATSVKVETRKKAHFQVDGEYLGRISSVSAHIAPGALRLIVPD